MGTGHKGWRGVNVRGARVRVGVLLVGLVLGPGMWALNRELDVSQYAHTAWKVRDGFAKGTINAITQTPDGYLLIGTDFGLLRFDGVNAVPWEPPGGQLPSNYIRSLLTARDGTIWIGTQKGLASWKDGKLTRYPGGEQVTALLEDHEGTVWMSELAVSPPGKLCAIRKGSVQCHGEDGAFDFGPRTIFEDSKGNLWAGVKDGLWRWKPGPPKFFSFPGETSGIRALAEDSDGALLFVWKSALWRFKDGKTEAYSPWRKMQAFIPQTLLRDRDGSLWMATYDKGLVHIHEGRVDTFSQPDGLSGNAALRLFEDREGDVWVATSDGLDRFREFAAAVYTTKQGLRADSIPSVLADRDGSVWLGGDRLYRWKNGEISTYDKRDGKINGASPMSLFQDAEGKIWVSTHEKPGGAGHFENGRFILSGVRANFIFSFAEDKAGNVWMADQNTGLFRLSAQNEIQQISWQELEHKDPGLPLAVDPIQDGLWVGFFQGGLIYYAEGRVQKSYTAADGLGKGRVTHLRFGSRGTLWAATEGGLSRIRDGRIMTLTSKNGLPCDTVLWSLEDDDHSVWLGMPCGLVQIPRSDLDAWAAGVEKDENAVPAIKATAFDFSDGMRSRALIGGIGPFATKSTDGKLWIAGPDGASVVDPKHLPFNKIPPPVHIERVIADRKMYEVPSSASGSLPLPALIRDLQIDYTALSLVAPEKIQFAYKLEGFDKDWQDVGNRRQAFYTNLPPKKYAFRVKACNNSGVWNEAGTFLEFSIAPAYYQTTWFRVLCVATFLALLWAVYQYRLHQIQRQFNAGLEARVNERTRIARELHDTLLQSFQGLLLRFQAVSELFERRPAEAKQTLDSSIQQASEAITEGRNAVQGLRSSTVVTNDLAMAVTTLGEQLAADDTNPNGTTFGVAVEGTTRDLHPILRDEIYRIACEAMRNAFRHAKAQRIEVELHYDEREFRLRVRDDGKGIDPKHLKPDGRAGHYGLHGMRERAKVAGGKLTVWSELDSGTEVELRIPAAKAYETGAGRGRWWLAEKFSGKETQRKS